MKEYWKDIEGYEGLYQISNLGRVKSFYSGKVLKAYKTRNGYLSIRLSKNGISHGFSIHRLVANAFIPNPENKPEVNHIDEDKTNNKVSNLEWNTRLENMRHGSIIQRKQKPVFAVNKSMEFDYYFNSLKEAAETLNLHASGITQVLKGRYKQSGGFYFEYAE